MPFQLLFSIITAEKSGNRLPHLPGAINHPAGLYILTTFECGYNFCQEQMQNNKLSIQ